FAGIALLLLFLGLVCCGVPAGWGPGGYSLVGLRAGELGGLPPCSGWWQSMKKRSIKFDQPRTPYARPNTNTAVRRAHVTQATRIHGDCCIHAGPGDGRDDSLV